MQIPASISTARRKITALGRQTRLRSVGGALQSTGIGPKIPSKRPQLGGDPRPTRRQSPPGRIEEGPTGP
jgi:hypothetical protein